MFNPEMLAAAQKMMANMSPEQMAQIAGMASKMDPDTLKNLTGGNAGLPVPSASQLEQAKEQMKNMSASDMKNMMADATKRMSGQNSYMVNGATVIKNEGNEKVRRGDYSGAIESFNSALTNLESCVTPDASVIAILQSVRLNMALCFLKLEQFENCIETCSSILQKDSNNVKALFRRGVAYRESGEIVKGATDLKMSLLVSVHEDETIKLEFEKTCILLNPDDLAAISGMEVPIPAVATPVAPSGIAQAREILEANPNVIEQMGDVFAEMDEEQMNGLLQMSGAGAGGMEVDEMKKILKNKDFMKSMTEMMKNVDLSSMMNGSSPSSGPSSGMPAMSQMVDAMPPSMFEDLVSSQLGGKTLPSFVTGSRMKWVAKQVMRLIQIWLFIKSVFAAVVSKRGRIVVAVLILIIGIYYQYGSLYYNNISNDKKQNTQ